MMGKDRRHGRGCQGVRRGDKERGREEGTAVRERQREGRSAAMGNPKGLTLRSGAHWLFLIRLKLKTGWSKAVHRIFFFLSETQNRFGLSMIYASGVAIFPSAGHNWAKSLSGTEFKLV
jgi:hypothetical protein